jgi:hypothetical protein
LQVLIKERSHDRPCIVRPPRGERRQGR